MICWTADGTTVRALLLSGAANAGKQKATLRKRFARNCFMLIILLDNLWRDAGLLASVAFTGCSRIPRFDAQKRQRSLPHCRHSLPHIGDKCLVLDVPKIDLHV